MTTIDDIKAQVQTRLGRIANRKGDNNYFSITDTDADETALSTLVLQGAVEIGRTSSRIDAQLQVALVVDVASYVLPASLGPVYGATLANDASPPAWTEPTQENGSTVRDLVEKGVAISEATGTPTQFGIYGEKLWVWPIPSASMTLRLYYVSESLVATGDPTSDEEPPGDLVSWMPPELELALVDWVIGRWLFDIEPAESERYLAEARAKALESRRRVRDDRVTYRTYSPFS